MKYYPVNLDIRGRDCLIVGGGGVATRKVRTLLACGARVTVVSPQLSESLRDLAQQGAVTLYQRPYRSEDLNGMFLVIGATDNTALNHEIHRDAEARNMLCNIADQPDVCNFILPAVISRGDLTVAISTSGASPAFAKALRREMEQRFGDEYAALLRLMRAIRNKLLSEPHEHEAHKPLFEALIQGGLIDRIREGDEAQIDRLLAEVLGRGYRYRELLPETGDTVCPAAGCREPQA